MNDIEKTTERQGGGGDVMTTPSKVQRWDLLEGSSVEVTAAGLFVSHRDYKLLEARCAELGAELANTKAKFEFESANVNNLELARARAEGRCTELEESAATSYRTAIYERDRARKAEAERDAFKSVLDDEVAENLAYMDKAGNLPDENITKVMYRVLAERDGLRRRISEAPEMTVQDTGTKGGAFQLTYGWVERMGFIGKRVALVVLDTAGDGLESTGGTA